MNKEGRYLREYITSVLVLMLLGSSLSAEALPEKNLPLHLSCAGKFTMVGHGISCSTKIVGSSSTDLISPLDKRISVHSFKPGSSFNFDFLPTKHEFVYTFQFWPDKPGPNALGPFSLEFQGKKLASNKITVHAIAAPVDGVGVFTHLSKHKAFVKEPLELIVFERHLGKTPEVVPSKKCLDSFEFRRDSVRSEEQITSGKTVIEKFKHYFITPKKAGKFTIDRTCFSLGGDNETFRESAVEVVLPN